MILVTKKKEKRKAFDTTKILICHLIILKSEKLTNTLKLNDIDLRNIFKIKNSWFVDNFLYFT